MLLNIKNEINNQKNWISEIENLSKKTLSFIKTFYYEQNKDKLAWLYNKEFMANAIETIINEESEENKNKINIVFFDLNWLKKINDNYWHLTWDEVIKDVWIILKTYFWENDNLVWKIYWDEFMTVSRLDESVLYKYIDRINIILENRFYKHKNVKTWKIEKYWISISFWIEKLNKYNSYNELFNEVDKKMYEKKREYYKFEK